MLIRKTNLKRTDNIMKLSCLIRNKVLISKRRFVILAVVCILVFVILLLRHNVVRLRNWVAGDIVDFSDWDNITGAPYYIVPNIIHFIKFRDHQLQFFELVNLLAAWHRHQPDRLLIHCDCTSLEGKYWPLVSDLRGVEVVRMREPKKIYGQRLSSVFHATDIARLIVLQRYGGIFLDFDVLMVRPLHPFRRFEMSLGWPLGEVAIGSQVLIAHRNARFLKLWFESYRQYRPTMWYYNAGQVPAEILTKQPHLAHRVTRDFGVQYLIEQLYKLQWQDWDSYYTIHLLMRHRSYLDSKSYIKEFDENNIWTYPYTYGDMVRPVLQETANITKFHEVFD